MATMTFANENWKDKRVIVTGGAGFIGSVLVWELNRRGCSQVAVVDFPARGDKSANLAGLRYTELVDPSELHARLAAGAMGKLDCIFHLGACSSTTETNERYLRENNFEYSRDLAKWALGEGVRFVYASSAATYGDGSAGMDDSDLRQLGQLKPLNLYGQSKQLMDLHARDEGWLDRIVGLKYFNVFGPNENHKGDMRSLVCKSYADVLKTGVIRLFKSHRPEYRNGEQRRDFLYVKDAVAMTLHLAANPSANGIFNIGSGQARSWNDLAGAVFAALGREPHIEYIEMPEAIRDKYQYFTQANIHKLLVTGYDRPITSLEDAVRDYVVNYLVRGRTVEI
ncbi:MAG TPA: ADP-glyceromanno-heptose 6-epimerase [Candidatus Saccharimonadales bacterium]|jgi:ADP-L-glycero-D-manno-heptose 6-epimerase|nr:ADP-glyceromanno-heptose 6-epimerase [Candidatus Saccharimonadales bacterium]